MSANDNVAESTDSTASAPKDPPLTSDQEVVKEGEDDTKEEEEEEEEWPDLGVFEGMEEMDPADEAAIIARCPAMFIAAEKGNVKKGHKRWLETIKWRRENKVGQILRTPHPKYNKIRELYQMYYHFEDKQGLPVYIERPSKINLKAMKAAGITQEDLFYHLRFINEFLWQYINRKLPPEGRVVSIIDIDGMGMTSVGGEIMDCIKKTIAFTGAHYPERCGHVFIVNAPWYFAGVWKIIRNFADPVTVAKTHVLKSSEIKAELVKYIDEDKLPPLLGGTCPVPLGESPQEKMMNALVAKLNKDL